MIPPGSSRSIRALNEWPGTDAPGHREYATLCQARSATHRLLHHGEHVLADPAFRPLPGRLHRHLPGLLLLRCQIVQLGLAAILDRLERINVLLRGDFV